MSARFYLCDRRGATGRGEGVLCLVGDPDPRFISVDDKPKLWFQPD